MSLVQNNKTQLCWNISTFACPDMWSLVTRASKEPSRSLKLYAKIIQVAFRLYATKPACPFLMTFLCVLNVKALIGIFTLLFDYTMTNFAKVRLKLYWSLARRTLLGVVTVCHMPVSAAYRNCSLHSVQYFAHFCTANDTIRTAHLAITGPSAAQ